LPKAGDVVGSLIDLETGAIEFFINGISKGVAFQEGAKFRKGKIFPFVQVYKCMISVHQPFTGMNINRVG
jgi:hypothetical protein